MCWEVKGRGVRWGGGERAAAVKKARGGGAFYTESFTTLNADGSGERNARVGKCDYSLLLCWQLWKRLLHSDVIFVGGGSRECTCEWGAIMNARRVTCDINEQHSCFFTGIGSLVLFILLPGEVVYSRIWREDCVMSVIVLSWAKCSSGRIVNCIPTTESCSSWQNRVHPVRIWTCGLMSTITVLPNPIPLYNISSAIIVALLQNPRGI